ncbi:MAG TPA: LemA family protein [Candidatus Marinimicrobia bacterium]|nr:LemA family protein [Candidatus Neomarinimicrobiota bacterium]
MKRSAIILIMFVLIALSLGGCIKNSYNNLVTMEEAINGDWAQVENQYQRRYDLVPNLVATVSAYAEHEKETFIQVTEARAKVGQLSMTPEILNDPLMLEKFQAAQASLRSALSRLMAVAENYPQLKANQNFLALQDQLEGTENRIAVERRRFNEAVREYNRSIRLFPTVIYAGWLGFEKRPYFEAVNEAATAPKVAF